MDQIISLLEGIVTIRARQVERLRDLEQRGDASPDDVDAATILLRQAQIDLLREQQRQHPAAAQGVFGAFGGFSSQD